MSRRTAMHSKKLTAAKGKAAQRPAGRPKGVFQAGNNAAAKVIGQMERSLGEDLSGVSIHAGTDGAKLAGALGAKAFTRGEQIFVGGAAPPLGSRDGQRLLAHELAHVVQQRRAGSVDGSAIGKPGDAYEAGADRTANHALQGQIAQVTGGATVPGVQREAPGTKPIDMEQFMKEMRAQIQKGVVPGPDMNAVDDKIKKRPADALVPKRQKSIMDFLGSGREDKGPKTGPRDAPKPAAQRDVGAEADKAIGTTLLPQVPLHMLYNKITGADKPKPKPKPAEEPEQKPAKTDQKATDVPAAPEAKPAQAAAVDLKAPVAAAIAEAQQKGETTAVVRLDAAVKAQQDTVLAQLQPAVDAALAQAPKVTTVKVYIGSELVRTLNVGGKK